jgi:two-component system, OmpR family, response regulator
MMKKILVVDDTKNIRTLLTTCLELNGNEVITASTGLEALELFESEKFDLAFLDIKLPEISGTEVLRRVRTIGINVPVVIMTAYATVKNAVECTKLGAVAYLQKPFTADKVKQVLNELSSFKSDEGDEIENNIEKCKSLIDSGELDQAFNLLKKTLSLDPSSKDVYYLIGKIHELKGNYAEAKRFYNISKQF